MCAASSGAQTQSNRDQRQINALKEQLSIMDRLLRHSSASTLKSVCLCVSVHVTSVNLLDPHSVFSLHRVFWLSVSLWLSVPLCLSVSLWLSVPLCQQPSEIILNSSHPMLAVRTNKTARRSKS